MKHEFEPKGRHTQKGLTDRSLEVSPAQVDEIIERTPLAQGDFQAKIDALRHDNDTFTELEIKRQRAIVDDILFPKHHYPTPLPNPRQ